MAFIDVVPEDQATGATEALYSKAREDYGYLPNMVAAFSLRPDYMAAWTGLLGAIKSHMEPRRYELVTLAAATALRSSYCALAHGSVLVLGGFFNEPDLRAIALDYRNAGLEPVEVAVMDFAVAVVRDAAAITRAEVDGLRAHGLSDAEICDVAAAAAARCFFSKFIDALGATPDAAYAELSPELRQALTIGRAIDAAPSTA